MFVFNSGTDPVSEAISRYYRAKTGSNTSGNILPPDIYMGLKFTNTQDAEVNFWHEHQLLPTNY